MEDDYFAWAIDQNGETVYGPNKFDALDAPEAANMMLGELYQQDIEFDLIVVAPNRETKKFKVGVKEISDNE